MQIYLKPLIQRAGLLACVLLFLTAVASTFSLNNTPAPAIGHCPPTLTIDVIPLMGSFDNLEGTASCVDYTTHKVAVYIYTGTGWWTKPTFANPLTVIQPNGYWNADVTTGGIDHLATMLIAFLVPNSYSPPLMGGGSDLPANLFTDSLAYDRVLRFSDFRWHVKQSNTPVGPGPNLFSGLPEDVWVDGNGRLHLRISQRNSQWFSSEVITHEPVGYGTYIFTTTSQLDQLDENIIVGLFTWDNDAPSEHYREIDIEIAKWGNPNNPNNAQFVIQPWDTPGNLYTFHFHQPTIELTHAFSWSQNQISFSLSNGHQYPPASTDIIESWTYATPAHIPPAGPANARINFWLYLGFPPANSQTAELIVDGFQYFPHQTIYLPFVSAKDP